MREPMNKQKGWIILEWGKEICNSADLLEKLPNCANGVFSNGKKDEDYEEKWSSLFCCGDDTCPHCNGDMYRGNRSIDLKEKFPLGIAVTVRSLFDQNKEIKEED